MRIKKYSIPDCPRIALLADLHNHPVPESVLRQLESLPVDIIAIAGDVIYGSKPVDDQSPLTTQEHVLPTLKALASIAPAFLSLGNHEKYLDSTDQDVMNATGVTVLDNGYKTVNAAGRTLVLGGLSSAFVTEYRKYKPKSRLRYPDLPRDLRLEHKPDQSWLEGFSATSGFHILLSHHPEYYSLVPAGIELTVSGHAHGGQINYWSFRDRRPRGLFAPGQGVFPRYTSGVYEEENRGRLVVTRGMSNTAGVPRLFNPLEVVVIGPQLP